jgi:hypothetical protein
MAFLLRPKPDGMRCKHSVHPNYATFPEGGLCNFLDLNKLEQQTIINQLKLDISHHYSHRSKWGIKVWLAAKAGQIVVIFHSRDVMRDERDLSGGCLH